MSDVITALLIAALAADSATTVGRLSGALLRAAGWLREVMHI